MSEERGSDSGPTIVIIVAITMAIGGVVGFGALRWVQMRRARAQFMTPTQAPMPPRAAHAASARKSDDVYHLTRMARATPRSDGSYLIGVTLTSKRPDRWTSFRIGEAYVEDSVGARLPARLRAPLPDAPLPATFTAEFETDPLPPGLTRPIFHADVISERHDPAGPVESNLLIDAALEPRAAAAPALTPEAGR